MRASNQDEETNLILASGSPRRRELLALLGLPFRVCPAGVEEANHVGESAAAMVTRLSRAKAEALLSRLTSERGVAVMPQGLIIAADTTVCLDGEVLGKPADPADALHILRRLRGRPHWVFSSVTVMDTRAARACTITAESQVWMRNYSDEEIAAYVATGDPLDKAGAYAIQYAGFRPVERIIGCYANVMGLPLCHLYCVLRQVGVARPETPIAACNSFNRRICDVAEHILSQSCKSSG